MLKDFLIALSTANLWFLSVWKLFLIRHPTAYPYYHWKLNPAPVLLATMLDVLLLTALLFLAVTLARRSCKQSILKVVRFIFVLVCLLLLINFLLMAVTHPPLGPIARALRQRPQQLFEWQGTTTIYSWLVVLIVLICWPGISLAIHSLIYRRQRLIKLSVAIALILSPFALVTFTQATAQWIRYRSNEQFREATAPLLIQQRSPTNRILWLIFDELDFRLTFLERPPTLELPEFDRLRKESIFAANSFPPGGDTDISLPALITGRLVSRLKRAAPNELVLTFGDDNQSIPWSTQPNVFSRARAMGLNTGLAGWYHPYCRVIGSSLGRCSWQAASLLLLLNSEIPELRSQANEVSVAESMLQVARSSLLPETRRLFFSRVPHDFRRYSVEEFKSIHQRALEIATDPRLNLIAVHYPIPHPPGIYDRHRDEFSFNSSSGYLDSLVLADRVLAQLRKSMIEAGIWENTTVLISSDHSLRAERGWRNHPIWEPALTKEDPLVRNSTPDARVPFILKLAGESEGLVYKPAFNTVLSHDLILAILSEEISKKAEVVHWLDRHRSIGESPYLEGEK